MHTTKHLKIFITLFLCLAIIPVAFAKLEASMLKKIFNYFGDSKNVSKLKKVGKASSNISDYSDELKVSSQVSRRHLSTSMKAAKNLKSYANLQAHHIIPWQLRNHRLIKKAAIGGFNMNGSNNGTWLSTNVHLGSHPKYTSRIIKDFDNFFKKNPNITDEKAAEFLNKYVAKKIKEFKNLKNKLE